MSRPLTALAAITRLNIIERKKKVLNNNDVKQNIHICIHLLGCDVIGEGTTPKETYCIFRPLLSELHKIFENEILKVTLLLNGVNFNMEEKSLNTLQTRKQFGGPCRLRSYYLSHVKRTLYY